MSQLPKVVLLSIELEWRHGSNQVVFFILIIFIVIIIIIFIIYLK